MICDIKGNLNSDLNVYDCINENPKHYELPLMPWDAISCQSPTPESRVRTIASDWWAAVVHLDTAALPHLHIHQMAHEYWWAGWGRSGCPVAAGHCGKLAPSLIVIRRPSSVSIKIGKDDTFGGTCSCEYVCMKRWRERVREEEERMFMCAYIQGHKSTALPW